jgi:hypothetical protein
MRAGMMLGVVSMAVAAMLWGCGPKPEHNANWYYYWEKDDVIPGLDREGSPASRWDWSVEAANQGAYGAAHGPSNGYVLTDFCITSPVSHLIPVEHKNDPDLDFEIGAETRFGVEQAAGTMAHEKLHIANYRQIAGGQPDTDGDGLADSLEEVDPYYFIMGDSDTYNLASVYFGYANYGDNEFIARQAEPAGVAVAKLNQDWSQGGAQWRH